MQNLLFFYRLCSIEITDCIAVIMQIISKSRLTRQDITAEQLSSAFIFIHLLMKRISFMFHNNIPILSFHKMTNSRKIQYLRAANILVGLYFWLLGGLSMRVAVCHILPLLDNNVLSDAHHIYACTYYSSLMP